MYEIFLSFIERFMKLTKITKAITISIGDKIIKPIVTHPFPMIINHASLNRLVNNPNGIGLNQPIPYVSF